MRYLIGADIGTTSMKIVLSDEFGRILCIEGESYEVSEKNSFEVEIDADIYWDVFKKLLKKIADKHKYIKDSQCAISVDSQGETLIMTDEKGIPLRNAIVWLDNRAVDESLDIAQRFSDELLFKITGQPGSSPTWPAAKILWLKKHENKNFIRSKKFLMVSDYINYKLTGKFVTERSLISSTLYFDINNYVWWKEMLEYIGINETNLPEVLCSGDFVSKISRLAAEETGLASNTGVYAGALDQMASSIGAGNTRTDTVSESTGTCLALCVNTGIHDVKLFENRIPCHVHALKDKYCLLFWSQTAGAVLEWFKNNFNPNIGFELLDREAGKIIPGSEGLIVLPHFEGTAVPDFNPEAAGVFFGLRLKHGKSHLHRAIMESIAYMLKEHIDTAIGMGIEIKEIISIGGGAKSDIWNQIKADVTEMRIRTLENSETAGIGCVIIAGVGSGIFTDIEDGVKKCVKTKKIYYPNSDNTKIYDNIFKKYKELYDSLKSMYK